MESEERWFWVWLSIFTILLGTAPFAYWQGYHLAGIICAVAGLGGFLMLIRDHLAATASKWPIRVSLKVLAIVALSMIVSQLIGHEIVGHLANGELSPVQWWLYGLTLLLITVVVSAALSKSKPSKLVIHWANYRAVENGGDVYEVGDFLRRIISGDSLVFDIENHNFVIGDKNFVPRDPLPFKEKRLQVNYSYGGQPSRTTERREHGRLLLPEDSAIQWLRSEIDRVKAAQPKPSQYPLGGLRLNILELCVELKGFLGEHGQEPKVERQLPESQEDFMQRWRSTVDPWRAKFLGDFRLKFGDSIPRLRDEIRVRAGIDDFGLNNLIIKAASDPNGNVKSVEGLTRRLWELAYEINA